MRESLVVCRYHSSIGRKKAIRHCMGQLSCIWTKYTELVKCRITAPTTWFCPRTTLHQMVRTTFLPRYHYIRCRGLCCPEFPYPPASVSVQLPASFITFDHCRKIGVTTELQTKQSNETTTYVLNSSRGAGVSYHRQPPTPPDPEPADARRLPVAPPRCGLEAVSRSLCRPCGRPRTF